MDWGRKHICELSGVCKYYGEDSSLTEKQRKIFSDTYAVIKPISSIPHAGGTKRISEAISKVCSACQQFFEHECTGRQYWQQPCRLLQIPIEHKPIVGSKVE